MVQIGMLSDEWLVRCTPLEKLQHKTLKYFHELDGIKNKQTERRKLYTPSIYWGYNKTIFRYCMHFYLFLTVSKILSKISCIMYNYCKISDSESCHLLFNNCPFCLLKLEGNSSKRFCSIKLHMISTLMYVACKNLE